MEFIVRAYPFRQVPNNSYARTRFMLAAVIEEFTSEGDFLRRPSYLLAQGDNEPLLGPPVLYKDEENQ